MGLRFWLLAYFDIIFTYLPIFIWRNKKVKGKVVYGQEPPSGESTPKECGFNYQQLAVITEVAQWGAPSCSQPQPATDNGVRDGRSNWLIAPPTLHRAVPPELHVLHTAMRAANHKTCCSESAANVRLQNARPTHCRCGHSGYIILKYLEKIHHLSRFHYNLQNIFNLYMYRFIYFFFYLLIF